MRNLHNSTCPNPAVRAEGGPNAFYKEAFAALRVFIDGGGTLVDLPSLAAIVSTPKSVSQSPSYRYPVWKRLQGKHLALKHVTFYGK